VILTHARRVILNDAMSQNHEICLCLCTCSLILTAIHTPPPCATRFTFAVARNFSLKDEILRRDLVVW